MSFPPPHPSKHPAQIVITIYSSKHWANQSILHRMLIGLCGGRSLCSYPRKRRRRKKKKEEKDPPPSNATNTLSALCAGKTEVANYLVTTHSFTALSIARPSSYQIEAGVSTLQITQNHEEIPEKASRSGTGNLKSSASTIAPEHVFPDANALLDFVTKRWREFFVTTDIWDEGVLDVVYKRPLFMLVSVDAPVLVRWGRFVQR